MANPDRGGDSNLRFDVTGPALAREAAYTATQEWDAGWLTDQSVGWPAGRLKVRVVAFIRQRRSGSPSS
jgi:hypothetical protein